MKVAAVRHKIVLQQGTNNTTTQRIFYPTGFGIPQAAMLIGVGVGITQQVGVAVTTQIYADQNLTIGFIGRDSRTGFANTAHSCHIYTRQGQTTDVTRNGVDINKGFAAWRFVTGTTYAEVMSGTAFTFDSDSLRYTYTEVADATFNLDLICIFFGGTGFSAGIGTFPMRTAINGGVGLSFQWQPELLIGAGQGTAGVVSGNVARANVMSLGIVGRNRFGNSYAPANQVASVYSTFAQYSGVTANNRVGIGTDLWMKGIPAAAAQLTAPSTSGGCGVTNMTWGATGISVFTRNTTSVAANVQTFMGMRFDEPYKFDYFFTPAGTGRTFINLGFVPQFVLGCSTGNTLLQVFPESTPDYLQASVDAITYWVAQGPSDLGKYNYGVGTISVTNGQAQVTGTGTSFFGQINEGDYLYDTSYNLVGIVTGVTATTTAWLGSDATDTLSNSNWFYREYAQYSAIYGGNDGANPTNPRGATGYTSLLTLDIATSTGNSVIDSGSIITFDGSPGFYIDYGTVNSTRRKLNWYLAFGAEQRQRRRATG